MKVVEVIKKDLKEYYRESMTFKIVLFSPIMIIAVFGLIFSGGVPSTINLPVKIAICSMDSLPKGFIQAIRQEKWVQVEELEGYKNCDEVIKNNISIGNYKGGIAVPEDFVASVISGNKSYLHVYVDNSLVGVEGIIRGYLWRVLQEYSQNFKEDPMTAIKSEFFNVSLRLKNIKDSISLSQPIKDFKSNAEDISASIEDIDTQAYNNDIRATNSKLDNAKTQIDSTYNEIESFRKNIQVYTNELKGVKTDLINYDNKTVETKNVLEILYNGTCIVSVPQFPDTMEACDQINSTIQELNQVHQDLQQKIQKIDTMVHDLEQADANLRDRENTLIAMKRDVEDSQRTLGNVGNNLTYLDTMKNKTRSFSNQIDSYSDSVGKEEAKMKSELGNFSDNINEILIGMSVLPLNPIQIETRDIFSGLSFLDFIIPSLITLLAMFSSLFLSCTTIIAERNSGTLTRNLLTPISLSNFICGKILSIILVGLAQLSAILLIGFFAFHIFIPNLIPQLILCIILSLFSFSVIGMFIGIWSDSGITAVLISITLMIVLLFISGITIPNELLPEDVVNVGKLLPLSNIFSLLKSLFVYKFIDIGAVLYLLITSAAGITACIISIKKQVG